MYPDRFIQYLHLPPIPDEIIQTLTFDLDQHRQHPNQLTYGGYTWSDYQTHALNEWCKTNVCNDLYYAIQLMVADVEVHVDRGTKTKLNFVIDAGGPQVLTKFYDDTKSLVLDSYEIEPLRWHIFKADLPHEVVNVTATRISITARIF